MRVLVCGDRNWSNRSVIEIRLLQLLEQYPSKKIIIVHGACRGADLLASDVAHELGFTIEAYSAKWEKYGRVAGPVRNSEMLDTGIDFVIAFHEDIDHSSGTKDTIRKAQALEIPYEIITGRAKDVVDSA